MALFNIVMIIALILITAFFVASEFAIVKVRATRIDFLAEQGNGNAKAVKKILSNIDGYLSSTQLGITITSLALGGLGEPTVETLLKPLFHHVNLPPQVLHTISFIIAFTAITYFEVVLGELAPKSFAIRKAEEISLAIAKPLIVFSYVMFPFIFVLNRSAAVLTRMLGLKRSEEHEMAHNEEELRHLLSESFEGGEINQSEYRYVNKIFEFDDRLAKEIMVPRTEIVCLYKENSFKENLNVMREEKFTRYPVAVDDKDHIVGLVNIKEFFNEHVTNEEEELEKYIRPIISVHESYPIQELLVKMQKERVHMAVLMDEYGGTSGIVTVEDIIEEIVGEIRDEFDEDEEPRIKKINDNVTILDGKVLISEVNELFHLDLDDTDLDTIGGWILSQRGEVGLDEEIEHEAYSFKVIETDGHQIKKLKVLKKSEEEAQTES
ncbi:hemolysin family protein [Fictibacillus sp. KU28468]|uniref:hemolysin family protein n=1 Tax=Fictibacillus sp. KU28468 TaxID=2991053 RepID=UPI00223DC719|nr:hemolysin family protein [Fictibacillus sp. KU28468]UZJ77329.1 hemolysin family protein [Fictibacillus sp. KU28468]